MSNRKFLISAIILILIIGIGAWLLAGKKVLKPTAVFSPSPIAQIQEPKILSPQAINLKRDLVKTDKEIGDLVLKESSGFEIKYLISNDEFIAHVKIAPFIEHKKAAEQWFIDKGFGAEDLCLLKITFTVSKNVQSGLQAADVLPTGCPVVPNP